MSAPRPGWDDYKDDRRSAFQLIEEEDAGWILAALLLACLVIDCIQRMLS